MIGSAVPSSRLEPACEVAHLFERRAHASVDDVASDPRDDPADEQEHVLAALALGLLTRPVGGLLAAVAGPVGRRGLAVQSTSRLAPASAKSGMMRSTGSTIRCTSIGALMP